MSQSYAKEPKDHGQFLGLDDDDHTQYLLADGSRALAGEPGLDISVDANGSPRDVFLYGDTVTFTSSSTFDKGDYPGLRAVKVKVQGAGGGGGGVDTFATSLSIAEAGGGGAGGYVEEFILAASLGASETVTVGSGGSGGAAGNNPGSSGGNSSFGSHCSGNGGSGGDGSPDVVDNVHREPGGDGGGTSGGDFSVVGGDGMYGSGISQRHVDFNISYISFQNMGGYSYLGVPNSPGNSNSHGGAHGGGYGSGGGGAGARFSGGGEAGGNGADGIVIIELYY